MRLFGGFFLILLIAAAVVLANAFYVVRQFEQVIVLELGNPVDVKNENTDVYVRPSNTEDVEAEGPATDVPAPELAEPTPAVEPEPVAEGAAAGGDEAGLHFKVPFIQSVVVFDKRNLGLDISDTEVLARDQERLLVDAFVRWEIQNPLSVYQRFRTEQAAAGQLERFTESSIREILGEQLSSEIISGQRAALMNSIRDSVNRNMAGTGIRIIDVRIRRADLPTENSERVYARMRTAREQEAQRIRSEGEAQANRIRAEAERKRVEIVTEANRDAEIIRGRGDARRNALYAQAFNKDPDFFSFYRSMLAYEQSFEEGTPIILSPDSDFFRFFGDQTGQGR